MTGLHADHLLGVLQRLLTRSAKEAELGRPSPTVDADVAWRASFNTPWKRRHATRTMRLMSKHRLSTLRVSIVLVLGVAGCGGGSTRAARGSSADTPAEAIAEGQTAAPQLEDEIDAGMSRGAEVMGVTCDASAEDRAYCEGNSVVECDDGEWKSVACPSPQYCGELEGGNVGCYSETSNDPEPSPDPDPMEIDAAVAPSCGAERTPCCATGALCGAAHLQCVGDECICTGDPGSPCCPSSFGPPTCSGLGNVCVDGTCRVME